MDKTKKAGPKPRYRWDRLQSGKWHTFKHGRDYTCLTKSLVSLLHRRADADGLGVETRQVGNDSVRFRFITEDE